MCSLSRLSAAANRDLPIDCVREALILNQKPSVPFFGRQWRRFLASIRNRSYFLKWCNFTLNHVKRSVNGILFCQIALSSSGNFIMDSCSSKLSNSSWHFVWAQICININQKYMGSSFEVFLNFHHCR